MRTSLDAHLAARLLERRALTSVHFDALGALAMRCTIPLRTLDALHLIVAIEAGARLATSRDAVRESLRTHQNFS